MVVALLKRRLDRVVWVRWDSGGTPQVETGQSCMSEAGWWWHPQAVSEQNWMGEVGMVVAPLKRGVNRTGWVRWNGGGTPQAETGQSCMSEAGWWWHPQVVSEQNWMGEVG